MPRGPRCFRWSIVMLSGPAAVEFLLSLMAFDTESGVKGEKFGSSLWVLWISLMVFLVSGSCWWLSIDVNCLLKFFAIACGLEKVLSWKLIGWFGGVRVSLPLRDLTRFQNFLTLDVGEADIM